MSRPRDFRDVVRAHITLTTAFLLAQRSPCIDFAKRDARATTGRRFVAVQVPPTELPASWTLAVILCPGDATGVVARFAKALPREALGRVRFYETPGVRPAETFKDWPETGFPMPQRVVVQNWRQLHRDFGFFVNGWTYQDASASQG